MYSLGHSPVGHGSEHWDHGHRQLDLGSYEYVKIWNYNATETRRSVVRLRRNRLQIKRPPSGPGWPREAPRSIRVLPLISSQGYTNPDQ